MRCRYEQILGEVSSVLTCSLGLDSVAVVERNIEVMM